MVGIERNIKIGYILSLVIELYFPIAVWFFFYSRYLSVQQIAVLTGFQIIIWNLFEVPTGAFADLVGRKVSIILAFGIYTLAMMATAFTTVFGIFLVIEFFKGISNALNSGSLEALLYDTLKEKKLEHRWDKVVANNETLVWVGLFVAAVSGGFLYYWWYPLPYLLQGLVYLGAMLISFWLIEPKLDTKKYQVKEALQQNLAGFKELFRNERMTYLTLVLGLIGAGYMIAASILGISQAEEYGLDARGVGLLFGTGYILSALASQGFPKLKRVWGSKKLVILTGIVLLSSFLLANFVGVVVGSMLIIMRIASSTTFRNVRSGLINRAVTSKNRATTLSSMQLLTQLPYALLAYFIGGYIDRHSPNQFALLLGVVIVGLLGATQLFSRRMKAVLAIN
ncbi:hypothetical protein A2W24_01850 [Microgenomates group bacterium RBG_16_45_19]|nr:MAG: hypothetical protein A2W24_01850 [Microgenomates group bacterium RBG_16_45_19]